MKPPTPSQRNRESFPLRRFLLCACGNPFTRCLAKSGTGKVYCYYFCRKCHAVKRVSGTEEEGVVEREGSLRDFLAVPRQEPLEPQGSKINKSSHGPEASDARSQRKESKRCASRFRS